MPKKSKQSKQSKQSKTTERFIYFKNRRINNKVKSLIRVTPCKTILRHKKCLKRGLCSYRTVKKHNLCFGKLLNKNRKTTRKNYCNK